MFQRVVAARNAGVVRYHVPALAADDVVPFVAAQIFSERGAVPLSAIFGAGPPGGGKGASGRNGMWMSPIRISSCVCFPPGIHPMPGHIPIFGDRPF